jgi:hypothetical protein
MAALDPFLLGLKQAVGARSTRSVNYVAAAHAQILA